ncbi:MAG: chorismate synthase [Dehalococcoidia bacterium]|nr:chorismate synthase [Dehalococcoidia bacterium]
MFRFLTAGESHGRALTAIVEGVPAGLPLDEDFLARDLRRRQWGYGRSPRQSMEHDHAEILSGVRLGLTLGGPITLVIWNRDWENWKTAMSVTPTQGDTKRITRPRPGHADLAGVTKYGLDDVRSVLERASARETAARVACGAVARRFLEEFGVEIHSHTLAIGGEQAKVPARIDWEQVEGSLVRCADNVAEKDMMAAIEEAMGSGDTVGGVSEVVAFGVPIGLGSHIQWDRRLDGRIARAMMSIQSVKGLEIGDAFESAGRRGSQVHDGILPGGGARSPWRRKSNHAGGIEGGISNGEPIVLRLAVKPIPTLAKPLTSVDLVTGQSVQAHFERSDVCAVPAVGVIGEAMLAMVLADAMLEKFGGDSMQETRRNFDGYLRAIGGAH